MYVSKTESLPIKILNRLRHASVCSWHNVWGTPALLSSQVVQRPGRYLRVYVRVGMGWGWGLPSRSGLKAGGMVWYGEHVRIYNMCAKCVEGGMVCMSFVNVIIRLQIYRYNSHMPSCNGKGGKLQLQQKAARGRLTLGAVRVKFSWLSMSCNYNNKPG